MFEKARSPFKVTARLLNRKLLFVCLCLSIPSEQLAVWQWCTMQRPKWVWFVCWIQVGRTAPRSTSTTSASLGPTWARVASRSCRAAWVRGRWAWWWRRCWPCSSVLPTSHRGSCVRFSWLGRPIPPWLSNFSKPSERCRIVRFSQSCWWLRVVIFS